MHKKYITFFFLFITFIAVGFYLTRDLVTCITAPEVSSQVRWTGEGTAVLCGGPSLAADISCPYNWEEERTPSANDVLLFNEGNKSATFANDISIKGIIINPAYSGTISKPPGINVNIGTYGIRQLGGTIDLEGNIISVGKGELLLRNTIYSSEGLVYWSSSDNVRACIDEGLSDIERVETSVSQAFEKFRYQIGLLQLESQIKSNSLLNALAYTVFYGNILLLLVNLINFFVLRKRKDAFGIIRDSFNKKPIQFAICKIFLGNSTYLSYRTLSDLHGRYSFPIIPGEFRLEVSKDGYQTFNKTIKISRNTKTFQNIPDIELKPLDEKIYSGTAALSKNILIHRITSKATPLTFFLGFTLAVLNLFINLGILTTIIALGYFILLFFYTTLIADKVPQLISIMDSKTGFKIPNALVKIIDLKKNKLIDTKLTNHDGYFDFAGREGDYGVTISAQNYVFPSVLKNSFPIVKVGNNEVLKVPFKRQASVIQIYIDPVEQVHAPIT